MEKVPNKKKKRNTHTSSTVESRGNVKTLLVNWIVLVFSLSHFFFKVVSRTTKMVLCFVKSRRHFVTFCLNLNWRFNHIDNKMNFIRTHKCLLARPLALSCSIFISRISACSFRAAKKEKEKTMYRVHFLLQFIIVIWRFLLLLFPFFTTFNKEILYLQYGNLTKCRRSFSYPV